MAKNKNFTFESLVPTNKSADTTPAQTNAIVNIVQETGPSTKVTFDCPNDLVEQMKDYGYWEGMSQKDIIIEALGVFFEDKKIKERPEKVKMRKKVGRKPKALKAFIG
ncbi:hypothetical protein Emtol_4207 [Emticicia oligotrophica DSM 17448]|uniref:CopG family transcriptional regulator n=1 Tax=Emticicia oligotrophica (strain DSM 17448 / CIP 109782 / MTCC 6937 / GPTSA100-15) TaxID=929562 RepID=A0ABM5N703_EMTOG|nr:hypothetical protein [Emticicia oligotrophica]AFK05331.1 hypothetical protein Emtol_4207 [Emticicia oligotrophica DSM 17448]